MQHKTIRRTAAFLLLALFLLSFILPLTHAEHDCTSECCAICQTFEHSVLLLCTFFFCTIASSLGRVTVRAFVHARARGRLFYTPIILHVKLSD